MNEIKAEPKKIIIISIIILLIILLTVFIIISNKNEENDTKTENNELNEIVNEIETNIEETNETNNTNNTNDVITENDISSGNTTEESTEEDEENGAESQGDFIKSDNYESVTSPTTFYTVKEYVDDFFECIANSDNSKLINILDEEYINENSINNSNVSNKLEGYNYQYTIEDISEYAYSNSLYTFLVEINQNDEEKHLYYALDYATGAYKIYIGEENDYINKTSIEKNEYNQFSSVTISDSTMCKNYLNMYIDAIKSDAKGSYYILNKEYRVEAFDGINDYVTYINENIDTLSNASVSKYKVVLNSDGSTEYTIVDNYGNYYIIYATSVMNYNIRLSK